MLRPSCAQRCISGYVRCLESPFVRLPVLVFYAVCIGLGAWQGLQLPGLASNLFPPLKGSRGALAQETLAENFPLFANAQPWTLLVRCDQGWNTSSGCAVNPAVDSFMDGINATVRSWLTARGVEPWDASSWFRYAGTPLDDLKAGFVNADSTSSMMIIDADQTAPQTVRYDLYAMLKECVKSTVPDGYSAGVTGLDCMVADANAVVMVNLERADAVSIPVAFIILAVMVRSWRILLIAAFNLSVVVLGAFSLMVLLIKIFHVQSQSMMTQFMGVMGLAMSIDYSLFIFSRFREELLEQKKMEKKKAKAKVKKAASANVLGAQQENYFREEEEEEEEEEGPSWADLESTHRGDRCDLGLRCANAVQRNEKCGARCERCANSACRSTLPRLDVNDALAAALSRAGHVVLMSGSTLIVSFGGYFVVDNAILTQAGIGVGTTVALSIFVNLTATPCWILTFPGFFTTFAPVKEWLCLPILLRGLRHALLAARSSCTLVNARLIGRSNRATSGMLQQPMLVPGGLDSGRRDSGLMHGVGVAGYKFYESEKGEREEEEEEEEDAIAAKRRTACWWRISEFLTRWPWNILVMLILWGLAIAMCCSVQIWKIALTDDFRSGMPTHSSAMSTINHLAQDFGAGRTLPFYLVLTAPALEGGGGGGGGGNGNGRLPLPTAAVAYAQQEEFFTASAMMFTAFTDPMSATARATGLNVRSFVGATLNTIAPQPTSGVAVSLSAGEACVLREITPPYEWAWEQFISTGAVERATNQSGSDGPVVCGAVGPIRAALTVVNVDFDPNTNAVNGFITAVRAVIDGDVRPALPPGYSASFAGYKVYEVDTVTHAVKRFLPMVVVTCALAFLLVGIFMRSAFMPVRLLLTLAVPLAAVYSLSMLVYQDGVCQWLWDALHLPEATLPPFLYNVNGFYWSIPIITFAICIGLALDYDVFLISRIAEHRRNGIHVRWAVPLAVSQTGSLITAAGVIMAVAFGSLLFMDSMAARQTGFILVTSVLFDTFVVRTLLVPAVMSMTDCCGWWPGKVPFQNLTDEMGRPVDSKTGDLLPLDSTLLEAALTGDANIIVGS